MPLEADADSVPATGYRIGSQTMIEIDASKFEIRF